MMNRQQFLRELDEIKSAKKSPDDPAGVCNRLYTALVDCLATESKNVEGKLEVLAAVLHYYIELRSGCQDTASPETDAFGHFLFMECSHLVLGMEFHHLSATDPYKAAFKLAISEVHGRLAGYSIGHVFVVLEWLMVHQWSHSTLVAMMKGEDVDRERALAYIGSGEYPELFRLRVRMLMESGCDNYACNLVSWCLESAVFETDIALKATHLLLLHKLGRCEQLHNQCCLINCCTGREILKYLINRSEEASFLLLISQTLLLLNWIKPGEFCCTKELLELWLTMQRAAEQEDARFLDSVSKVAALTQDTRLLIIFLDSLVNMAEFLQFCSELALTALRRERQRVEGVREGVQEGPRGELGGEEGMEGADGLSKACLLIARLYRLHPQMHLACLLAVFALEPTDAHYRTTESACLSLPHPPPLDPLAPPGVHPLLYADLLDAVEAFRPACLHQALAWDALKPAAVARLEESGCRYDPNTDSFTPVRRKSVGSCRQGKLAKISTYLKNSSLSLATGSKDDGFTAKHRSSTSVDCQPPQYDGEMPGGNFVGGFIESDDRLGCTDSQYGCGESAAAAANLSDLDIYGRWSADAAYSAAPNRRMHFVYDVGSATALGVESTNDVEASSLLAEDGFYRSERYDDDGISGGSMDDRGHAPPGGGLTLDDIQQVLGSVTGPATCDGDVHGGEMGVHGGGGGELSQGGGGGGELAMDERALSEITAFLQSELCRGNPEASAALMINGRAFGGAPLHRSHFDDLSPPSLVVPSDYAPLTPQQRGFHNGAPPGGGVGGGGHETHRAEGGFGAQTSTILVTETNLPYLQQFLPNLQTVMQSVQSYVSATRPPPLTAPPPLTPPPSQPMDAGACDDDTRLGDLVVDQTRGVIERENEGSGVVERGNNGSEVLDKEQDGERMSIISVAGRNQGVLSKKDVYCPAGFKYRNGKVGATPNKLSDQKERRGSKRVRDTRDPSVQQRKRCGPTPPGDDAGMVFVGSEGSISASDAKRGVVSDAPSSPDQLRDSPIGISGSTPVKLGVLAAISKPDRVAVREPAGDAGSPTSFCCRFCRRGFASLDERRAHTAGCGAKKNCVDTSLRCAVCAKLFVSKHGRTTHMNRVHGVAVHAPSAQLYARGHRQNYGAIDKDAMSGGFEGKIGPEPMEGGVDEGVGIGEGAENDAKTIKDCFVKVRRLDGGQRRDSESSLDESDASDRTIVTSEQAPAADAEKSTANGATSDVTSGIKQRLTRAGAPDNNKREGSRVGPQDDALIMCDGCGDLLRGAGVLPDHALVCAGRASIAAQSASLPLRSTPSSVDDSPPGEGLDDGSLAGDNADQCVRDLATGSVVGGALSSSYRVPSSDSFSCDNGPAPVTQAVSTLHQGSAQPIQPPLNQGAVFEMLQIAEHFLRLNALGGAAATPGFQVPPEGVSALGGAAATFNLGGGSVQLQLRADAAALTPGEFVASLPPPPSYDAALRATSLGDIGARSCGGGVQSGAFQSEERYGDDGNNAAEGNRFLYDGVRRYPEISFSTVQGGGADGWCGGGSGGLMRSGGGVDGLIGKDLLYDVMRSSGHDALYENLRGVMSGLPLADDPLRGVGGAGKEILYEGTRMLEFVEYQCDACLLTFTCGSDAARHVDASDHVSSSVASYHMYHCADCGIRYRDKQVMRNHSLYLCASRLGGAAGGGDAPAAGGGGRLYACRLCFKTFIGAEYLRTHENLKHAARGGSTSSASSSRGATPSGFGAPRPPGVAPHYTSFDQQRLVAQRYPNLFDASAIARLYAGLDSAAARGWLLQTPPPVASVPTLGELTAGLPRVRPSDAVSLVQDAPHTPILYSSLHIPDAEDNADEMEASCLPARPSLLSQTSSLQMPAMLIQASTFLQSQSSVLRAQLAGPQAPPVGHEAPPTLQQAPPTLVQSPLQQARPSGTKSAKGIYYKNVFMQCEGTYFCAVCRQDLSGREAKRTHRLRACGDPKSATYSRRYTYLCPYCAERFPSQKSCRQHQIAECLRLIGVSVDDLSATRELSCPLCPKKYVNLVPLKGHMTQAHKLPRSETRAMLDRLGYVEEMFDARLQQGAGGGTGGAQPPSGTDFSIGDDGEVFGSSSMLFDFDNEASSELIAHTGAGLEDCPAEMDVIYDGEMFGRGAGITEGRREASEGPGAAFDGLSRLGADRCVAGRIDGNPGGFGLDAERLAASEEGTGLVNGTAMEPGRCDEAEGGLLQTANSRLCPTTEALPNHDARTGVSEAENSRLEILSRRSSEADGSGVAGRADSSSAGSPRSLHSPSSAESVAAAKTTDNSGGGGSDATGSVGRLKPITDAQARGCRSSAGIGSFPVDNPSPVSIAGARQPNDFFVMMFRNYPILAKGVSICAGCQAQLGSAADADAHAARCVSADGAPAFVKRSTVFKCTHCEQTFWKAKSCRQHQVEFCLAGSKDVEGVAQPSVACPLCAVKSYNRSGLMSHMKFKHTMDTKGVRDCMIKYGIEKKTIVGGGTPGGFAARGGASAGGAAVKAKRVRKRSQSDTTASSSPDQSSSAIR